MIIVLNGMIGKIPLQALKNYKKKLIFTTKHVAPLSPTEQIIIEDVGVPSARFLSVKGFDSVSYTYMLSDMFIKGVSFFDDHIEIFINGAEGLDLGASIRILENISRYDRLPEVFVFVEAPPITSNRYVLGRFYAWIKMLMLYDIYMNSVREGALKIIFSDNNSPPQLYKLFIDIIEKSVFKTEKLYSIIDVRVRRYLFPIVEMLSFLRYISLRGEAESLVKEYSLIIILLNELLNIAPADLWDIARKSRKIILSSIHPYRKLVSKVQVVDENITYTIKGSIEKTIYTRPLVSTKELLNMLLSGYSLSDIIKKFDFDSIIDKLFLLPSNDLVRIYQSGREGNDLDIVRMLFISEDLKRYVNRNDVVVVGDRTSEINIVDYGLVIECESCGVPSYFPYEYYASFNDRVGIYFSSYFPDTIRLSGETFTSKEISVFKLMNYTGFKRAYHEGKISIEDPVIGKIRKLISLQ